MSLITQKMFSIAVIAPLEEPLTYSVSPELYEHIQPGQRVLVPLGRRKAIGIILKEEKNISSSIQLKSIEKILQEEPMFTSSQLQLIQWASDYYLIPIGEMFRVALPSLLTSSKEKKIRKVKVEKEKKKKYFEEFQKNKFSLSEEQQKIADIIYNSSQEKGFGVHLIHGITGSGKTEIYFEILKKIIDQNKQAICLVPEISLTPQSLERYQNHFGEKVQIYHSGLNPTERLKIWEQCQRGEFSILLGTRSALFAPFKNLGIIIIDEEQDSSYKQEERARYHARDLAIVRAKIENIPILLGSATPSVESYSKAKEGKFFYYLLQNRFGSALLPKIQLIDLKQEKEKHYLESKDKKEFSLLSSPLLKAIGENLMRKEQTLLFLNRRGFSHFILCRDCGDTMVCPNCDITLTYHQKKQLLVCHYCDHHEKPPAICKTCQSADLFPIGTGTEKIEIELKEKFPEAKILRMDRDTTSKKESYEKILKKFKDREIDILIGTQMVAKGHDYPYLTLVGILFADAALHHPDFRSNEKTFQLITQVAGRAGRADLSGEVLLQTYAPEHSAILWASRYESEKFYQDEIQNRQELSYPPFTRLILFRIQGTQKEKVKKGIGKLREILESLKENQHLKMDILGPSSCLVERVRNYYRWQILIKTPIHQIFQKIIKHQIVRSRSQWLENGLRLVVEVDPIQVI